MFQIIIPSYENRPNNIFNHLNHLKDKNVLGFIYKDEYKKYKKYNCDYILIDENKEEEFYNIELDKNTKSIQGKRLFIQNWCIKNNIFKIHSLDDDLMPFLIDRNRKILKLNDALELMENHFKNYDLTIGCFTHLNFGEIVLNRAIGAGGTMSIDFSKTNVKFKTGNVNEDIAFYLDNLNNLNNVLVDCRYKLMFSSKYSVVKCHNLYLKNMSLMYPDHFILNKNGFKII